MLYAMSFADVLAEIPRLTPEQRREVLRRMAEAEAPVPGPARGSFRAEQIDGRLLLVAPRMIRQSEVDAILADFP